MYWEEEDAFCLDSGDVEMYTCNTRKVRCFKQCLWFILYFNRTRISEFVDIHLVCCLTAGLVALVNFYFKINLDIFSYFLVTIFDELFRSEGVQQVYAIVTEWLADLDKSERRKIKWV